MIVNKKLESIWKEISVTCFKEMYQQLTAGVEKKKRTSRKITSFRVKNGT
jgi:hypothetical protein